MVRIVLDVETAEEPNATVFNRVLFKVTKDELIYNATFQEVGNKEEPRKDDVALKAKVLCWMRDKDVPIVSVARYLGMQISSVKNLLYTKALPITPKRAEQLKAMMQDEAFLNSQRLFN